MLPLSSMKSSGWFTAWLLMSSGATRAAEAPNAPAAPSTNTAASEYPSPPAVLPGKGLAHHDFLFSGEWDTRKTNCTMFLIRGGKVVWMYQIPRKDRLNGQESEY